MGKWCEMHCGVGRAVTAKNEGGSKKRQADGQTDRRRQAGRLSISVMPSWTRHDKQLLMKAVVSCYLIHGVAPWTPKPVFNYWVQVVFSHSRGRILSSASAFRSLLLVLALIFPLSVSPDSVQSQPRHNSPSRLCLPFPALRPGPRFACGTSSQTISCPCGERL